MKFRRTHILYWLLAVIVLITVGACEKADFGKPDEKPTPTPTPTDTINKDTTATVPSVQDTIGGNVYISVALAKLYAEGVAQDSSLVVNANGIVGYIVGVVNGTSLKDADFTPPFTRETNLLIADNPLENDVKNCMPVQLPINTSLRKELNLVSNPDNYGKRIIVEGTVTDYFKTIGINPLTDYMWVSDISDNDSVKVNPSGNPVISTNPELILGGR